MPVHLISDNVLVAYELMHFLNQKKSGKYGFMSLKLDISNAYDRVEWSFLEKVICKMGFGDIWIQKIIMCVRSVSFFILINGEPTSIISPSKGILQGNPLSSYLFLFCTEGLISLVKSKGKEKNHRYQNLQESVEHQSFVIC